MADSSLLLFGSRRPLAIPHPPIAPPFDPSDSGGQVHTTPPPEFTSSWPAGPGVMAMRADFNGVTLSIERWKATPPVLVGANTTPVNMLMTPMAPLYPRFWQDAMLTEHAERGYSHFVVASEGWNFTENGFSWTPQQFAAWCAYVASWGFFVVDWAPALANDPYIAAARPFLSFAVIGEEVDSSLTAEQYEAVLDNVLATTDGLPLGAHFTSNYPEGFPRDTFLTNWSKYDGQVHLCWQANQDESAGTQAARCYYARQRVNLGTVGGDGLGAPHSRVYAFETMATAQLYGKCTEGYGCLRSLELLYATRTDPRVLPMSGFGNGCRLPDGSPI